MVLQRKRSLFLGLGLSMALVLAIGLSPVIAAAPASDDLVAGAGKVSLENNTTFQFTANAHGTPTDAHGFQRVRAPAFTRRGEIDCLFVLGNRAAASGTHDGGGYFATVIEDNGEPSATNPTPDRVGGLVSGSPLGGPPDCGLARVLGIPQILGPVVQGNFVVIDRP
jgi:hypothetical protein